MLTQDHLPCSFSDVIALTLILEIEGDFLFEILYVMEDNDALVDLKQRFDSKSIQFTKLSILKGVPVTTRIVIERETQ